MTDTPNHKYNMPSVGTSDWHIPLNENFEQLDIDVEIRGKEKNKGEFEPKQGAKFEATDSGAVYLGDGDSWILIDRTVKSLQASRINGVHVPDGNDIHAFRDAVQEAVNETVAEAGTVRLRPDVTYNWEETFVFDPADGFDLRVEAHNATIEHSSDPAVQTRSSVGEEANRLSWHGGKFIGPGDTAGDSVDPGGIPEYAPSIEAGTSTFRLDDSFGHTIRPDTVQNVRAAIYVRNVEKWSEGLKLGHTRNTGATGEEFDCDIVFLCLSGGFLGTDGGGSMRNIQIQVDWGYGGGRYVTLYQGGAGFQGGSVILRTNLPSGIGEDDTGWGWFSAGNLEGTFIHFECEFGGDNTTAIEFAGGGRLPPVFRFRDPEDRIINKRSGNVFFHRIGGGIESASGAKGYDIRFDRDEWEFESNTLINAGSYATNSGRNITRNSGRVHSEMTYYNGSNSEVNAPAGWYWWDEEGHVEANHWVLMGDTDTTVSPY